MRTIYNWQVKRSGNCLTVYGDEVDSAGAIRAVKLINIGAVTPHAGMVYAYGKDGLTRAVLPLKFDRVRSPVRKVRHVQV